MGPIRRSLRPLPIGCNDEISACPRFCAQGQLPRSELIQRLRASLRFYGYSQIPQLECPAGEKKKRMLG